MFCKNCGQQIPDNSAVCPNCAAPIIPAAPQQPAFAQPAPAGAGAAGLGGVADNIVSKTNGLPVRLIAKIALVLALLAFFLPFVSVSCNMDEMGSYGGDMDEVVDELGTDDFGWGPYSGFSIMFGKLDATKYYGIPKDMQEEAEEEMDDEMSFMKGDDSDLGDGINIWMWLSFLCGVGGVVMLFVFESKPNKMSHVCAGLAAGGALFVLIGRITFLSNTKLDSVSSMGDFFETHTKWGFFLCLLFFLAGAAACAVDFLANGKRPAFLAGNSQQPTAGGGYPQAPFNSVQPPVNAAPPAGNQFNNFNNPQQPML
ncbi:MAG: zinc ribbon domain-containing protein [Oscillospiraceae bacterium]|nr:zinc ribbon domain-containing protein [Oscillospiraceae bacterium]